MHINKYICTTHTQSSSLATVRSNGNNVILNIQFFYMCVCVCFCSILYFIKIIFLPFYDYYVCSGGDFGLNFVCVFGVIIV